MFVNDINGSRSTVVLEREIKINANSENLFSQLTNDNIIEPFVFVVDTYYDYNDIQLLGSDEVLRLRQINDSYYLAYKGERTITDNIIKREEYEVSVSNELIYTIIQRFFYPRDIVEKKRAIVHDNRFPDLIIYCDIYPFIGRYIDVEGDPQSIRKYINYYSIPYTALEKRNCTEIFIDYCENNSLSFDNLRCAFRFANE